MKKSKQILTLVSGSALASGMAQGAIVYSGPLNIAEPCPASFPTTFGFIDMNGDGINDFNFGFDGVSTPNSQKPYIQGLGAAVFNSTPGSAALATSADGLPLTAFGTMINSSYEIPVSSSLKQGFFCQEDNNSSATTVGSWGSASLNEAYVGVVLYDTNNNSNYGWVRMIYNGTVTPRVLTLVDWGYETIPSEGIPAGATNEVGCPNIYVNPLSQTVATGAKVIFKVTELASPAPTFQWATGAVGSGNYPTILSDGGIISGSSTSALTLNGISSNNAADYVVTVSNTCGGVTSSPATLTVVTPAATPTPQVLFGGLTANFNVSITGSVMPTYQWQKNGTNLANGGRISGVLTSNLHIGSLVTTDTGNYDVLLTFPSSSPGASTSASLTVLPQSGESLYEAAVLANKPMVYYTLNETGNPATNGLLAYDNAGGINGVYGPDVNNGFDSVEGPDPAAGFPGFSSPNPAAEFFANDTNSIVTLEPWNVTINTATFTAWINPSADPENNNSVIIANENVRAGISYFGSGLNDDMSYRWFETAGLIADEQFNTEIAPPPDQWSFVAASITASNASVYVFNSASTNMAFLDGTVPSGSAPNGFTNSLINFALSEYIGGIPSALLNFQGVIGQVAVFNTALTSNQLQGIYDAALGQLAPPIITPVGGKVQLTWQLGTLLQATNVTGPWVTNTNTSPYLVTPTTNSATYYVLVAPY